MTLGVSKYCRRENDSKVGFPAEPAPGRFGISPVYLAYYHLEFTARYEAEVLVAGEASKTWFAYPEEFEAWLDAGSPGLFLEELEAYIAENPIEDR